MFHWVLHCLLKLLLDGLQPSNVLPRHVGNFHHRLAQRRGVGHPQRGGEVVVCHRHCVKDLCIDGLVLEVNDVHLLADALQRRLRAQCGEIRAHISVRLLGDLLQVHLLVELHVFGVDAKYFQAPGFVRNSNVDLTIEAAKAAQRGVDGVGAVGGTHDNDVCARLHAVHEREQLRHDAALHLTLRLFALGSDGVDLVDENDGGRILLRLLECLAQVGLRLTGELGHDFRAVDEEEKRACLVGHRACDECLA
mmetsp:Transcript_1988/g.3116  ORF Transcript_1988/g.3116 Transcript_1988/m.3116 type:complete len:251 (+) Transcript_1988:1337-2089(+)